MEETKLKIPKSFFENFDTIVKYQNLQLIRAICEFKDWGKDRENEIIECFFNGETPEKKIKHSKVEIENEINKPSKPKRLVKKKSTNHVSEKIIFIQKPIEIEGKKYLLEDPTNNLYDNSNNFVGIFYKDSNGIGKINTRSQEN
jgi:hypothetical protein